ncbi:MAG: DMSO reductase [Rhodospirillaceae bacterium]|nr:DMSO reductase [Rhodospirillaceae bacterium]|tara:strand:- start:2139 stop:3098 length:960 start_codon:yes stop_codon:yes gene_type:complete
MYPAVSIVLFTSLSGAGYGALVWLGLFQAADLLPQGRVFGIIAAVLALACVVAGLVSSTFHLRHPERVWRAFSQWRSSWLSREGVMAMITFVPALVFLGGWILCGAMTDGLRVAGMVLAACSVVTMFCTAMIYRSLWTIPHWHNDWTVPSFLVIGLAGGALLVSSAVALAGGGAVVAPVILMVGVLMLALALFVKAMAWRDGALRTAESTTGSALGMADRVSSARLLESPNSSENYLQREMVFRIARKHAAKLRRLAFVFGIVLPLLLLILAYVTGGWFGAIAVLVATGLVLAGSLIERWLFFAEARHKVSLYYGAKSV